MRPAVGRLVGTSTAIPPGSGFAIAPDAALTARHVVAPDGHVVRAVQLVLPGDVRLDASVVADDEVADLALLRLGTALPEGWVPVPLVAARGCARGTPFLARGYPADRPFGDPAVMDGHVVDVEGTAFDGVPVVTLFSPQVAAPVPRDPHGFSGAPVLVRREPDGADAAVAVVRWGQVDPASMAVRAGTVLASPVELVGGWQPVADALAAQVAIADGARAAALPGAGAVAAVRAQYLGRQGHAVAFGGRERELRALDGWLRGDDACCLVVAPAGLGKSALVVRWLAGLTGPTVFVPISLRVDLARDVPVLRALGARLAHVHGEPAPTGDADSLRDAVVDLLSRPVPDRVVVVVDGLDEAEGWEPGPGLLGGELGDGVRLLLTARATAGRPTPDAWRAALGLDAASTRALALGALDRPGVVDVLRHASGAVPRLAADDAAVDALVRATGGDPLVLSLYVADLERRASDDLGAAVTALPGHAAGLDDVLASWWAAQRRLWAAGGARGDRLDQVLWAAFDVLACALGPLRRSELLGVVRRLVPVDGDLLDDALRALDRFTLRDAAGGLSVAHPRIAEHRRLRLAEDGTRAATLDALVGWCTDVLDAVVAGDEGAAAPYAARHLGAHLEASGAGAAALQRLVDPAWRSAWEAGVEEWNGYVRDVERAGRAARTEAAARVGEGRTSPAAADAVEDALVAAGLRDATALMSGALAAELVRHGLWSERRAVTAVLDLPADGPVVRGLRALAPRLGRSSLDEAVARVLTVDPVGWWTTHAEAVAALAARRADLEGAAAAVGVVAGLPPGTGRAVALLELLRVRPDTAAAGAVSPLVEDLTAIADGRNGTDVPDVLHRLADCLPAATLAASLTGDPADVDVAVGFARCCLRRRPPTGGGDLGRLLPVEVGALEPWLGPDAARTALEQVVDDTVRGVVRDARGDVVDLSDAPADVVALLLVGHLDDVVHRLPADLADRAAGAVLDALDEDPAGQELAMTAVALAERLPEDRRDPLLAPVLDHLVDLLGRGGRGDLLEDLAAGLGRVGRAGEVFRGAAASPDPAAWYVALVQAAAHLAAPDLPDALATADRLPDPYRPWVLVAVLARLAAAGPAEARDALRRATTPGDDLTGGAAGALRSADAVVPVPCRPTGAPPRTDDAALPRALALLRPVPGAVQHDHAALLDVLRLLPALDVSGVLCVARAAESVPGVSSRNVLRGPLAVRLARLGAVDAALAVPLDPYHATAPMLEVLAAVPDGRLDEWLAAVHRRCPADLHAQTRLTLMSAVAGRVAACAPAGAWALLEAWLDRRCTRAERLIDLHGYAPALLATAGREVTWSLAGRIADPPVPT